MKRIVVSYLLSIGLFMQACNECREAERRAQFAADKKKDVTDCQKKILPFQESLTDLLVGLASKNDEIVALFDALLQCESREACTKKRNDLENFLVKFQHIPALKILWDSLPEGKNN